MIRSLSLTSIFSFACACSSADLTSVDGTSSAADVNDEGLASSADVPSSEPSEEVLNTLRFDDLELSFIWLGNVDSQEGSLAINEKFRVDYVGKLREQYGALTSLELFNALAPEGVEPHPLLVARHESEARAYGRSGGGLGLRDIDARTLTIDKSIPANCTSQILPNISSGSYTETQSQDAGADGRYIFTCAGSPKVSGINDNLNDLTGCERFPAHRELTVGVCNDSVSTGNVGFSSSQFDIVHGQRATARGTIVPNRIGRFTLAPDPNPLAQSRDLAVLGRNNPLNVDNFHVQKTGVGVYP
jgi:hypothetical protein